MLKLQFCGTHGCMTPNSKSLKDKKEYWNPHRWKKGWICNSWGSNASPLDDNWKFDDNENYCSLKFLALEVGRFFGIFNQDKCIRRQRWRRCAQAFYFNISILQVEINNSPKKLMYVQAPEQKRKQSDEMSKTKKMAEIICFNRAFT